MAKLELFMVSLLVSVTLETGLILLLVRGFPSLSDEGRPRYLRITLYCVAATLISISWLWWILPLWMGASTLYLPLGELLVILFEGLMYRMLIARKWSSALLLSGLANGFSFTIGILMWALVPGFGYL